MDNYGRPRLFSGLAMTTTLIVKCVFSMSLRGLQGFVNSVFYICLTIIMP
ncbi:hypothetical protein BTN50_0562 [Candidatus Enterovibrio altilux]|uniref:Transposase DDE domain-containing protein n=1 Tax=Candidatus Enterovibrio altilux TaxID=1927128 RepID=A0A291B7T8_9GAMM|nr:hypothetical protein BTN50_0562 [Candidatus Enterovibrio luxaltus]